MAAQKNLHNTATRWLSSHAFVGALHNETESTTLCLIRNVTQFEASTTCVSRLALNLPPF
jgi:hypothetical protein